jgi:tetratricopeptide (TPR) repeat protein
MKQFMLVMIAIIFGTIAHAQSEKFVAAMQKQLTLMDSAKTTQDFQNVANNFERIGDAEKNQWLPYYYAGLALTTAGWRDKALDKDANSEKVKALCAKAEAIENNADICTIRNMAASQQMQVDPQSRWMTYGQEAGTTLQKGMSLDASNPRLYYLQGMSVFNTPPAFGGGKDKAKPIFEKALELYKAEKVKPLHPHWGQTQTEQMLAQCK